MTLTELMLRRTAMSTPVPDNAKEGDLLQVELHGQMVRNGEPGRITLLTDEWIKVSWP